MTRNFLPIPVICAVCMTDPRWIASAIQPPEEGAAAPTAEQLEFAGTIGNYRAGGDLIAAARARAFHERLRAEGWSAAAEASVTPYPDPVESAKTREQVVIVGFADHPLAHDLPPSLAGLALRAPIRKVSLPQARSAYGPTDSNIAGWRHAISAILADADWLGGGDGLRRRDCLVVFAGPLGQPGDFWSSYELKTLDQVIHVVSLEQFPD